MASVAVELRAWLLSQAAVTALTTRIMPAPLGQTVSLPAITYFQVSGNRNVAQDGDTGLARYRYQLDCWADDYAGCDALATAVKTALSAMQWGNLSMIDSDRDMAEPEFGYYRRIIDVFIWHKE